MRTVHFYASLISTMIAVTFAEEFVTSKNESSPFAVWIETVAGFNPMVLVAYDILTANETRMSLWDRGSVRSLENIPLTIYEEENPDEGNQLDMLFEKKVPLIEKIVASNVRSIAKILKDPKFGLYVERWMNVLRQGELENLKILRKVLARREIGKTFKEMDLMSKIDTTQPVNPSDFKEMIAQSLDSLITVLSGRADNSEVVAGGYVGACAKVLLLKLQENESSDFNLHNYLEKFIDEECKASDIQKRANRLMAVVNSGILLEGILINKGILPSKENTRATKELHELYSNAEHKVNQLVANCEL